VLVWGAQSEELSTGDLEAVAATPEQLMLGFVSAEKGKVRSRMGAWHLAAPNSRRLVAPAGLSCVDGRCLLNAGSVGKMLLLLMRTARGGLGESS